MERKINQAALFVSGLPEGYTWGELKTLFGEAGEVAFADVFSRGVGQVRFKTDEDAAAAIQKFNGVTLPGGKPLIVKVDEKQGGPRPGQGARPGQGVRRNNVRRDDEFKAVVSNLDFKTPWFTVKDAFGAHAEVAHVKMLEHNGRPSGQALVMFNSEEELQKAIEAMNGTEIDGRQIQVRAWVTK
eukprot:TRINITY_DN23616_c0_g1_i1.p1 TRINITY_DN23616_c0_g1~~TRINITY_DN23616_c0_g1_i1.p1  ORF type:complete len:185 (+),score=39.26 TRINITY_DN23616_c0_g1_i1:75-629(+)